ncbi:MULTISPECIES: branched-chain amino acid ABC transporter substrate-binding protein [unclassified Polaromonas]|uniref:branched-chain amino acid ABC transporter substrate-binding protein n=1 Tax=unclassified Polaromonas TaxID=2638319 RepID=UPI000F082F70|nr:MULTISPECIES: branched-chain amino acid ABC transporter substrate-binding protein [unclassified Polaromonas]AYQ28604.1 branched-chain amino acid ABC transporter substrate-binding protein [Polaromonas sp. SP1]QGJ20929.1 ABC transporter substrate-binding protein [Polaromonas sp. Pch-P]
MSSGYCVKSVLSVLAVVSATSALAQDKVKIGIAGPLSGPAAHYGKDNERGAQLAIEDLNASQFKIGGKAVRFELVSEDDQADPKQGTAVAQKLVDDKVNGVVGHNNSGTTIPAARIYSEAGLPHITPAASNPKLTQLGYKTTFRTIAHDGMIGSALAVYAATKLKLRNVALIDDRTAYGQGLADEFEKTFKSLGGTVVAREFTNDKATDFSPILTTIKGKRAQAIFFGGLDAQAGAMLRQMVQLGIGQLPFMGGDGVCTGDLPKLGAQAVGTNVICGDGGEALMDMKGGPGFAQRYKAAYKSDVVVYAPYAYDNVMILANAMQAAGSAEPAKYLAYVGKTKYEGITGLIEFDGTGQRKKAAVTLSTYPSGVKTTLVTMK